MDNKDGQTTANYFNGEFVSIDFNPAQEIASILGLSRLSTHQKGCVDFYIGELLNNGIVITEENISLLKQLIYNVREGVASANLPEYDIFTLKRLMAEFHNIVRAISKTANPDIAINTIYGLEKYLRINFDRDDVVHTARALQLKLGKVIMSLIACGYSIENLYVVGSYARRMPRNDSDADFCLLGYFSENPSEWIQRQSELNQELQHKDPSLAFDYRNKNNLIDIFPRPYSFKDQMGVNLKFDEKITLESLIP